MKGFRKTVILAIIALQMPFLSLASPVATLRDSDLFEGSIKALELFMTAATEGDAKTAAKWLADYDLYPPRAISRSRGIIKRNEELFLDYLTIADDIYGYEIKKSPRRIRVTIEGVVTSRSTKFREFSAEMVYERKRWRVLDISLD